MFLTHTSHLAHALLCGLCVCGLFVRLFVCLLVLVSYLRHSPIPTWLRIGSVCCSVGLLHGMEASPYRQRWPWLSMAVSGASGTGRRMPSLESWRLSRFFGGGLGALRGSGGGWTGVAGAGCSPGRDPRDGTNLAVILESGTRSSVRASRGGDLRGGRAAQLAPVPRQQLHVGFGGQGRAMAAAALETKAPLDCEVECCC